MNGEIVDTPIISTETRSKSSTRGMIHQALCVRAKFQSSPRSRNRFLRRLILIGGKGARFSGFKKPGGNRTFVDDVIAEYQNVDARVEETR